MKVITYPAADGGFRWRLLSRNGLNVANPGQSFGTRSKAKRAFLGMRENMLKQAGFDLTKATPVEFIDLDETQQD